MDRREFMRLCGTAILSVPATSKRDTIRINAVGDVTLGRSFPAMFEAISHKFGQEAAYRFPFEKVKRYFREGELNLVNLECALTKAERAVQKRFTFKGDPSYIRCLTEAGINGLNLANNHFMDFYEAGALDTIETILQSNITYFGGGKNKSDSGSTRYLNINGIDVALLGYAMVGQGSAARDSSPGTNPLSIGRLKEDITEAESNSDIVIVSCHWGIERLHYPTTEQRNIAKVMADSGADIVLGHHPHVIQGIERYGQTVVFYSLGNFVFGGNTFPNDIDSMIAQIECNKSGIENFSLVPVKTHPEPCVFQPYKPSDAASIIAKITTRTEPYGKAPDFS